MAICWKPVDGSPKSHGSLGALQLFTIIRVGDEYFLLCGLPGRWSNSLFHEAHPSEDAAKDKARRFLGAWLRSMTLEFQEEDRWH